MLDWSIAASYKLFGVSDWSARLPVALSILFMAIAVFFFGKRLFVFNAAGFYAALFVLVFPGTFLATRELTSTPYLALEATLLAFLLWEIVVGRRFPLWVAIAASALVCIVAVMTGKWPGFALPLALVAISWIARSIADPVQQVAAFQWSSLACAMAFTDFSRLSNASSSWIFPAAPLALLLADWLTRNEAFSVRAKSLRAPYYLFAGGLLCAATGVFFALHGPVGFTLRTTPVVVTAPSSRVPLLIVAAAFLVGTGGNLLYRRLGHARIANCFLAGTLAGITVAMQVGSVLASPWHSSQILAEAIRPELEPSDVVAVDGRYPEASSLAFYLERPVLTADPTPESGVVALDQVWNGPARVFLWIRTGRPVAIPGQSFVVASSGGKQILSNRPNSAGAAF